MLIKILTRTIKDKLRMVTGRSSGMSIEGRKAKLNQIIRGHVRSEFS